MSPRGRDNSGLVAVIAILGGIGLTAFAYLSSRLGIPFAIPVGIVGAIAAAVALHGPLGKALARRLEGGSTDGDETTAALLGEMDELRQRMAELEERVDFSERLLAQHPDRGSLAQGSDR